MPRILIADDHAVARRGLKEILLEAHPHAQIETVSNAEELMTRVIKQKWDLVITDITMPGRSGLEILGDLRKEFPDLAVLIISVHPEDEYALRVIRAGAAGYLTKDDAVEEELVKAVDVILQGRKYITPSIAEMLAREVSYDTELPLHQTLSDREFEILILLAKGRSTGEIAAQLALSVNTIGSFRSRILAKMNMKNNAELVTYAVRNNLV